MSLWSYGLRVQTLWKQKYKDLTPRGPPSVREEMNNIQNSADADGGPRSRVRTAGHSAQPPIDVSGNFSAHMSAESPSNISPNP